MEQHVLDANGARIYEEARDKGQAAEHRIRWLVNKVTGLSLRRSRKDAERWNDPHRGAPFDCRIYDESPTNAIALAEIKDRTNYSPLSRRQSVFINVSKARRLIELDAELDLPVVFIVLDTPGHAWFAPINIGYAEDWPISPQPHSTRPEDEDVYEIPFKDFTPIEGLRQYLRDCTAF